MKVVLLAAMIAVCRSASAAEVSPVDKNGDLLSRILQVCPLENRRVFLGSIRFIGDRVAGLETRPIKNCLGTIKLDALAKRLKQVGSGVSSSTQGRDIPLQALFTGCSTSVRNRFYDQLQFRDGHLVGMPIEKIRKCGEMDIPRFLSLFGTAPAPKGDLQGSKNR